MLNRKFIYTIVLFLAAIAGLVGYGYRREQRLKADFQKAEVQFQKQKRDAQSVAFICGRSAQTRDDYVRENGPRVNRKMLDALEDYADGICEDTPKFYTEVVRCR